VIFVSRECGGSDDFGRCSFPSRGRKRVEQHDETHPWSQTEAGVDSDILDFFRDPQRSNANLRDVPGLIAFRFKRIQEGKRY
jgi:hypothetical protein